MIPDIYLNDSSMLSCGWLRESVDFPAPQPQNDIFTVPGRNSPIRYAEALGRVSYQPREFTVVLSMLGTHAGFIERSSDIINRFNGRLVHVTKSEDPKVYAVGTLLIQPSYDALTGKGILTISCTDADAYLYHVTETVQSVTGNASIVLDNDFMPVVPTVTTTAQTTLSWSISGDSFAKTLSAGTWTIPELELQAGSNTITVSGAGTTTFRYREGTVMKVFRVYVDSALFYHPHLSKLSVTEAKLTEDAEGVDSFTLSAPHDHPYLSRIQPMASEIMCKYGDAIVFKGRALDIGTDFYNTHSWQCEAALAYLRDSQQPPFAYTGSLCGLLELFLNNHNSSVEDRKQFILGDVTVTDSDDYINRSSSEYLDTMSAVKSKLLDTHGGYLRVRYESDGNHLDWLADFDVRSAQTVEFGKNLLDVKIEESHEDRVTALIPFGAKITETDEDGNETETDQRVTIDSVNDGKHYVCDEAAVEEIGWIWTTEIWEDITLPQNLLTKAKARVKILSKGISSIELTIIDESITGADIDDIHARQYVVCKSPPHGLDDTFLCTGRTRDYLNASGNTITIGAERAGIASITAKQNPEKLVQNVKIELEEQISSMERKQLYRVEITTKGSCIFTDKGMAAVLSAHVYAWNTEITAKLDASCFAWHRSSSDEAADAEWDSYHVGMKSITVTTEDVQDNASFRCEVNIQE